MILLDNNLEIKNNFTNYLNEGCWLYSDYLSSIEYFPITLYAEIFHKIVPATFEYQWVNPFAYVPIGLTTPLIQIVEHQKHFWRGIAELNKHSNFLSIVTSIRIFSDVSDHV